MNATEQLIALLADIPAPDASPVERASFYRRKATTFDAIANESDDLYRVGLDDGRDC